MKIALFLGAGASKPFNKPTTVDLKEKLAHEISIIGEPHYLWPFLNNAKYPDIEYVFEAIRQIRSFGKSLGIQFFSNAGFGLFFHKGDAKIRYEDLLKDIDDVERVLENKIYENYGWEQNFNKVVVAIYDEIFNLLKKHSEIKVFTTNYDRAIEQYCELKKNSYRCVDGFGRNPPDSEYAEWVGKFDDRTYGDGRTKVVLCKLHGSLNWKLHENGMIVKTNEESKPTDRNYQKNILIYPTLSPKEEENSEPFRSIQREFTAYMESADMCVVIGFSFRDSVSEIFKRFISKGKKFMVISPSAIPNFFENLLKFDPTKDFHIWKGNNSPTVITSNPKNNAESWEVHLIPKKLAVNAVQDIANEIYNAIIYKTK